MNPFALSLPAQLAAGAAVLAVAGAVVVTARVDPNPTQQESVAVAVQEPTAKIVSEEPIETEAEDAEVPTVANISPEVLPEVAQEADPSVPVAVNDVAEEEAVPQPTMKAETPETSSEPIEGPSFDVVRVDTSGAALIAGTAEPGEDVQVVLEGIAIETVRADQSGAFVAMVQLPEGDKPQTVGLQALRGANEVVASAQTVLVVPPIAQPDVAEAAPMIVVADRTGAAVLQPMVTTPQAVKAQHALSLETISYDQGGAVVLSGRGGSDQFVRVYVNNRAVETEPVPDDGKWRLVLPGINEGVYTLRVDQISPAGAVLARVESPFKREAPAKAAASVTEPANNSVTVQPGHTLWQLAQSTYGDGVKYVQIFHANRDRIRDANLIYPGQVFELPE